MEIGPLLAETYRLQLMRGLEERLAGWGLARVAGVDEAGRGALAGPVFAAAVVMDPSRLVPGVDDSKLLTPALREELARLIRAAALAWRVEAAAPGLIDRVNILEATRRAMRNALLGLSPRPAAALVDAVRLGPLPFPALPLVRGDRLSYSVACASILAKVERDRYMTALDRRFPGYGFADHKGYGAPAHREALAELGPCPEHRLTFRSVLPTAERGAG